MTFLQPGTVIGGRLRIDALLGAGGMGLVVAATHLELGNRVAVKIMRDELAANPTTVERFIREARAVVQLRTEHVCRVFDVGRLDNGAPYIVMELLEGADLARAIAKRPLPVTTAVDYVIQACVALAEAHAQGIVHRDLKPANLFVTRRLDGGPLVKVLDFGIAKAMVDTGPQLTMGSGMMGSPGYMSPEQLQSARDVDSRTDIWALGVTLYQLVTGRMPFTAPTIAELAIRVAQEPPDPIDVEPQLASVIRRCLEKDPARRYGTAAALAHDLTPFASTDGRRVAALAAQLGALAAGTAPTMLPAQPVGRDAMTAASIAQTPAPLVPTPLPEPTPSTAPPPRSKLPLVLGGVALVSTTVAITLAVGSKSSNTTQVATAAPADAIAVVDAGQPDAPRFTIEAPDIDIEIKFDAGTEAPPRQLTQDEIKKMQEASDQMMRAGCAQAVAQAPMLEGHPYMAQSLTICACIVGNKAMALKYFKRLTKDDDIESAAETCKHYGVTVRK